MKSWVDWVEGVLLLAVLANTIGIVLASDQAFMLEFGNRVTAMMMVLNVIFAVEYVVRLAVTQRNGASWSSLKAYALSFFGVVDFLSILPSILAGVPGLVAMKTLLVEGFRLLKLPDTTTL